MANKYQLVNEMANETIKYISQSSENWIEFLNTASNNYKYSFSEQVLIYAQKANATACADIETWNKRLKRWVNKGAKGIALLSIENGRSVLRHVFDISDTHSGIGQDLKLWEVKPSYTNGIIETLENSFGNLEIKDTLAEAIYSSSINLVEDNFQDYLVDLKEYKRGLYEELMIDGKMEEHLGEIEQTAQKRMKQIITSLAEKNQITEKMKRENQMEWVQAMNSIRNQAEEMIIAELIYN